MAQQSEPKTTSLVATKMEKAQFSLVEELRASHERFGKSYGEMVGEIARASFSGQLLTAEEYFWHRLPALQLTPEELAAFAGAKRAGSTNVVCNDIHWAAVCSDKLVYSATMAGMGMPVAELVALVHAERAHHEVTVLRDPDALGAWLRSDDCPYPLFGKPLSALNSLGAASLTAWHSDDDTLEDLYGNRFPTADFVEELGSFFDGGYLFERRVDPHPDLAEVCGPALSTVRMLALRDEQGAIVWDAAIKLAVHGQIADNFWRGNLIAGIDLESGAIERVITAPGRAGKRVVRHPDTDVELIGLQLPDWQRAKEVVCEAMLALPGLGLVGWDVGLSADGPVLVEANVGSDWTMVQLAAARGMWHGRLKAFAERRFKQWKKTSKTKMRDLG